MIKPFDALTDAIAAYSGYTNPASAVYQARNPGGLQAFSPVAPRDEDGNRVFKSAADGMQALQFDVKLKVDGKSKRKCETLADLAAAYNRPITQAKAWAGFLRKALNDETITAKTPLTFFQEQR